MSWTYLALADFVADVLANCNKENYGNKNNTSEYLCSVKKKKRNVRFLRNQVKLSLMLFLFTSVRKTAKQNKITAVK